MSDNLTTENPQDNANETTAQPVERNPSMIYVKRGEEKNQFSQLEWDALGPDKAGWELDAEEPDEVKKLKKK